ncbi:hypothetical protein DY000_02031089 [Brassica cretica]|uniref:Uncharacterized protein n=1 Tax=Brassica cretica TaxID=69181 RepID=A0ABQ7DDP4_BRACR|nr:hypothetical protein DY000_02031089 [Brassica cretica]
MAVDEQDNLPEATPREAELQRRLDGLQSQVTDIFRAWEAAQNPEISPEDQNAEGQPDRHSEQMERSNTPKPEPNREGPGESIEVVPPCYLDRTKQFMSYSEWPATLEETHHEEVSSIEEGGTWMTPLIQYLEDDILPEDRNESRKIKKQAAREHMTSRPDFESSKVWHLGFHPHQQTSKMSDSGFCRSNMQHRNSIVTSFRGVECEVRTGTGSSLT